MPLLFSDPAFESFRLRCGSESLETEIGGALSLPVASAVYGGGGRTMCDASVAFCLYL
ncbi:hypothetical protein Hanom_Chr13g01236031 [Helianthus anomalus]